MCVICVSEKGVRQPTKATLQTCFQHNPDGAGYMYARNGKVIIHKGFTTFEDFWRAVRQESFTKDDPVVYHFRIGTQGAGPEMTHPFPLDRSAYNLKALDLTCPIGVAHNGIIRATCEQSEYSDTALYIARYLVKLIRNPGDMADPYIADLIEMTTSGSRLAILNGFGDILRTGPGWVSEEGGLWYSNTSYKPYTYVRAWPKP